METIHWLGKNYKLQLLSTTPHFSIDLSLPLVCPALSSLGFASTWQITHTLLKLTRHPQLAQQYAQVYHRALSLAHFFKKNLKRSYDYSLGFLYSSTQVYLRTMIESWTMIKANAIEWLTLITDRQPLSPRFHFLVSIHCLYFISSSFTHAYMICIFFYCDDHVHNLVNFRVDCCRSLSE